MNTVDTAREQRPRLTGDGSEAATLRARREFLARSLHEARGGDCLLAVTVCAQLAPIDLLLQMYHDESSFLWEPPAGPSMAGVGAACRLEPAGPERFSRLRKHATTLFEGLEHRLLPEGRIEAPGPRFYGGFAFEEGGAVEAPWNEFGDACFTLPRWCYVRHEEQAWLRLIIDVARERGPVAEDVALAEYDRIVEAFLRGEEPDGGRERRRSGAPAGVVASLQQDSGDWPAVEVDDPDQVLESVRDVAGRRATLRQLSLERWTPQIEAIRAAIREGHFEKIVAARSCEVELAHSVDDLEVVSHLRESFPSCVTFAFRRAGSTFLGATPEQLIARQGREIFTEALAGSIRSGREAQAAQLLSSGKDLEEHRLVVREIVAGLEPMCARLAWGERPQIRRLRHILHLLTPIRGTLKESTHVLELVEALHPTPAVGGVPAREAVRWISRHEASPRGWYAGPIGWFDAEGNGEFAVALRSGVVRGRKAWIYAGGGIVRDSDPTLEYAETALKQKALLGALGVET